MSNPKVYNIAGNLVSDVKINLNKHNNFYAVAHIHGPKGETTVVTHAKKAIASLSRRKVGEKVSFYGAFVKSRTGIFGAKGLRPYKQEPVAA
jgi:hypothetical protein